jgi:AICAR transformylase/IMP cyclohydrolase PurH
VNHNNTRADYSSKRLTPEYLRHATVTDEFNYFIQVIYPSGPPNERQLLEMKKVFMAGIIIAMTVTAEAATLLSEDEACRLLDRWHTEMGKFSLEQVMAKEGGE